jgi:hypothetical protein
MAQGVLFAREKVGKNGRNQNFQKATKQVRAT